MKKNIYIIILLVFMLFSITPIYAASQANTVPLYRYCYGSDQFYTTNYEELGGGKNGYIFEGILGYVYATSQVNTVPLYRYWTGSEHFYSTKNSENGYRCECIEGYVYSTYQANTLPLYRYSNGSDHFYTTNYSDLGAGKSGYKLECIEGYVFQNQSLPQKLNSPTALTAIAGSSEVNLAWNQAEGAASYNIKRAITSGGPYTTIATTSAAICTDTNVSNGTTYYYVVSAINDGGESENSNEVSAIPKNPAVTLEVRSVDKAKTGDEITANVVIHNAEKICAEDIKIAFDTSKLEFVSAEGSAGIKIYKEAEIATGIKRYITASLGKANAANGDKILLKLKFKAIAKGEAKIDITKGRIADNATLEADVEEKNCGEKTILIEGTKDVNRSGEYTLLDLGIDAWYYGDAASDTDTSKYDADQDGNGKIDDDDLTYIVNKMLNNPNYFK